MKLPNLAVASNSKIAIACSGGVDSMCLAFLAAKNNDIIALIIDHKLREESASEAKRTSEILDGLGIENVILSEKREINSNLQAAARRLRYDLLIDYCKQNQIEFLATAHHADDNAETVLMKLSRGSGVDGLSGVLAESLMDGVKIIRPLLQYNKAELQQVLEDNNIEWVQDPSNETDKYKRNKLRHALAEIEDAELLTKRLNDTAENMQRVREFLEIETEKACDDCFNGELLDIEKFKKLHDEIAFRLLVKIIMQLTSAEQRPRFEKIKLLKKAIEKSEKKTLGGLLFEPKNGKMLITLEKEI